MYSENNRRSSTQRADNDFLRRMLGGELTGDGFPVMNLNDSVKSKNTVERSESRSTPTPPQLQNTTRIRCDGTPRQMTPDGNGDHTCPTSLHAPALAMVYSPRQCWRNLFDPATGLSHGTIFAELALPLEVVPNNGSKEVKSRRPM